MNMSPLTKEMMKSKSYDGKAPQSFEEDTNSDVSNFSKLFGKSLSGGDG